MDRIFYKSDVVDAYSGHPIYIFDTSYLPSTEVIDYELFIPTLMKSLPDHPYVLLMFSCGLNKISWIWGIKFLKAFLSPDSEHVENLHKVIAVHESWFVKSITQILTNFSVSKKSLKTLAFFDTTKKHRNLLTSCDTLSHLSHYVEITKVKLSLNIYKHDAQICLTPKIDLQCPIEPIIGTSTRFSPNSDPVFYHHFYELFHIVDLYGHKVELLFHKPGNRMSTDILFQCMLRNQLLWINDWDLFCIASCFKKILMEVRKPLIAVDNIVLPMKDDLDYTLVVFNKMMAEDETSGCVLFQVLDLCSRIVEHSETTKHTPLSLLKCMCHPLTHGVKSQQNSDRNSIAVRYIKNLLVHWAHIRPLYLKRFRTVDQIVGGEDLHDATIDELYNMSHDITIEEEESTDDENYRVYCNTSNILSTNAGLACPENNASRLPPKAPAKRLGDISNAQVQWPPQKYKFEKKPVAPVAPPEAPVMKKPVIRGRKVGELTRLFEERSQAMELLRNIG